MGVRGIGQARYLKPLRFFEKKKIIIIIIKHKEKITNINTKS
jgi:hypothetical protein